MKSKEFMSTKAVADMTDLSLGTIQKMVDSGVFSYYLTLGGHRRISRSSVEAYLRGRDKQLTKSLAKEKV